MYKRAKFVLKEDVMDEIERYEWIESMKADATQDWIKTNVKPWFEDRPFELASSLIDKNIYK